MFPPTGPGTGGQVSVNRKLEGQPDSLGSIKESNDFNNFRPSVASSGMAYDYQNINIKDQLVNVNANSSPEKSNASIPTNTLPLAVKFEHFTASGKKVQVSHL